MSPVLQFLWCPEKDQKVMKGPASDIWGEAERQSRLFSLEKRSSAGVLSVCAVKEMGNSKGRGPEFLAVPCKWTRGNRHKLQELLLKSKEKKITITRTG